jgi:P-type Cu2+ transporter
VKNLCWHCGEPLLATVVHARVGGELRAVCCHGCRAAAEWIEQLGLTDYYSLRTEPATKPGLADATDRDCLAWQRDELARHVVRDLGEGRR